MKKTIFLAIVGIFLLVGGYEIFNAFMLQHTYYASMFASMRNRWLVLGAFACAVPALYYFITNNSYKLPILGGLVAWWLAVFGLWHTGITDNLWFARLGVIMQLINTGILLFLATYFVLGVQTLWSIVLEKVGITQQRWQEMLLSFWIGLGLLLFVVHYLVFLHLLYGIIIWAIFLGLGYLIYRNWYTRLAYRRQLIEDILQDTKSLIIKDGTLQTSGYIFLFLIAACIVYYFFGFQLSFIPYPTAWDANHAYMYIPKVWAENHGALGVWQPGGVANFLWFSYIAFWFALIEPIKSFFWLSPDTVAVNLNFLSGIFVMIFGIGLVRETLGYVSKKLWTTGLITWRIGTLIWLTSGMGAFLVFVDNKTDLWVFAMTILALLSWMIFLDYMDDHKKEHTLQSQSTKYVLLSSILFGLAVMSKPTAFVDVAVFAIFVLGLWFWNGVAIGAGITLIGLLGKLQVLTTSEFLMPSEWMTLIIVWVIIMALSFVYTLWRHRTLPVVIKLTRIFVLWALWIGAVLLIGKWPYVLYQQIATDTFGVWDFAKWLLLSNNAVETKDAAYEWPERVLASTVNPAFCSLSSLGITQDELYTGLTKADGNWVNEDVGRYIWFWWREFKAPKLWSAQEKSAYGFVRLGYPLLRLLYPGDNKCFAYDDIAQALCEQPARVDNFDIPALQKLLALSETNSKWYHVLSGLLSDETVVAIQNWATMDLSTLRSEIVQLRQFYQSYSIKTTADSIAIPYRYLIPMNVVFNRSLQNLSSYYTDIWFVRLLVFGLMVIATIYFAVAHESKKLSLALATLIWWVVWWIIGGGIVWYGIGLIMWSILVVSVFLEDILHNDEENTNNKYLWYVVVWLALLWVFVQWFMNSMRIASQGASGPFVWYKQSVWQTVEYSNQLVPSESFKIGYNWKDVFDLQFPHYNKFVEYVKDRPDEDGVHIEGTYLQYFLDNQHNLGSVDLAYLLSDGDTCKWYLRIVDKNKKWLVIDPNVLSVVMGEGNESLLRRFFGKRNASNQKFDQYGNVSMLMKLWQDGYISLFSTNNLGAKYAFSVSDAELQSYFGGTGESLLNTRARLAVARFFPDTVNNMVQFMGQMFTARMANGLAIGDMADIIGKIIDEQKLLQVAQAVINGSNPATLTQAIDELTQDERIVLVQYLNMYTMLRQDNQQYMQTLNQLLWQSVGWGSQIIILEVKD